jgi:hypothetical protein
MRSLYYELEINKSNLRLKKRGQWVVVRSEISGKHFVDRDTGSAKGGSRKGRQHHDKLKAMRQGVKIINTDIKSKR